jgi:hypothetical protein|tara:strand:- start:636 stop:929 length:294 start_codon:yes stop_codon:yes gene_type:complete
MENKKSEKVICLCNRDKEIKEAVRMVEDASNNIRVVNEFVHGRWSHQNREAFLAIKKLTEFVQCLDEPGGVLELASGKVIRPFMTMLFETPEGERGD